MVQFFFKNFLKNVQNLLKIIILKNFDRFLMKNVMTTLISTTNSNLKILDIIKVILKNSKNSFRVFQCSKNDPEMLYNYQNGEMCS